MSSHEATAQAAHDDDLDDDPVISKIRKTGCLEKHFDVLECIAESKDWRKCQEQVKSFRECITAYEKSRAIAKE